MVMVTMASHKEWCMVGMLVRDLSHGDVNSQWLTSPNGIYHKNVAIAIGSSSCMLLWYGLIWNSDFSKDRKWMEMGIPIKDYDNPHDSPMYSGYYNPRTNRLPTGWLGHLKA